jgi:hypothetical protein
LLFDPENFHSWLEDRKFHSLFALASHESIKSDLAMREHIVYHTNQAYPDYLVTFELKK